jgi:hypothetical protein
MFGPLPNGVVFIIEDIEYTRKRYQAGLNVYIPEDDFVAYGKDPMIDAVLEALSLDRSVLTFRDKDAKIISPAP